MLWKLESFESVCECGKILAFEIFIIFPGGEWCPWGCIMSAEICVSCWSALFIHKHVKKKGKKVEIAFVMCGQFNFFVCVCAHRFYQQK